MTQDNHENKVYFVTGANRGIGKAIVEALLKHKVKKIYAAARNTKDLHFNDPRIVPVQLDITNLEQVKKAAALATDVQILINNAGTLALAPIVTGKLEDIISDMQVNYFGAINMVRAFAPILEKNNGGTIANISSIVGLAPMHSFGGYCASKAALTSATVAMRSELKSKNIKVLSIYPGPIDTDMAKDFEFHKTSASTTAENILAGIANGSEDIFPDPMSAQVGKLWATNPKELERQMAKM